MITKEKLTSYLKELIELDSPTSFKLLDCDWEKVPECRLYVKRTRSGQEKIFNLVLSLEQSEVGLSAKEINSLLKQYSSAGYDAEFSKGEEGDEDSVTINLVSEDHIRIFEKFIYAILEDLSRRAADEEKPLKVILDTLQDFQHFFAALGGKKLSNEKIIGLWGELHILHILLKESGAPRHEEVLESWRGPERGDQDFITSTGAIEVKCAPSAKKTIKISSLAQLDSSEHEKLMLAVVQIKSDSDDNTSISLFGLISEIRNLLGEGESHDTFNDKVEIVGYSDKYEEYYSADKYLVDGIGHFDINENTPVLTSINVSSPPIKTVRYIIDISSPEFHSFMMSAPESYWDYLND